MLNLLVWALGYKHTRNRASCYCKLSIAWDWTGNILSCFCCLTFGAIQQTIMGLHLCEHITLAMFVPFCLIGCDEGGFGRAVNVMEHFGNEPGDRQVLRIAWMRWSSSFLKIAFPETRVWSVLDAFHTETCAFAICTFMSRSVVLLWTIDYSTPSHCLLSTAYYGSRLVFALIVFQSDTLLNPDRWNNPSLATVWTWNLIGTRHHVITWSISPGWVCLW